MKLPPDLLRPLEEIRRVTGRSALANLAEAVLADLGHPHFTLPAEDTNEGLLTREALAAYRVAVTREAPFQDILGPVHQAQLTGQKQKQRTGQFFTPWPLARMMAKIHLTGWTPGPAGSPGSGRFLWTVNEPALGCGGMLLAFCAEVLAAHGPEGLNWWSCSGVDVDREVTLAAAAQFCMNMELHKLQLGELVIVHGNTLSCESFGFYLHLAYPGLPAQLLTPFVPTPQGHAPVWLVRPPTAAAGEPAPPAEAPGTPAQTDPAAKPPPTSPPRPGARAAQLRLFDAA
ncbi:MAG TPA: N-6 DNA methylase [Longimicrobiaceae bacterium]|nr:N-6 DNA methylase [Longimicrobiaceae bacterium]